MRNTSGLKRSAGPGRPKGRRNKIPTTVKAALRNVCLEIAEEHPEDLKTLALNRIQRGGKDAFQYWLAVQHYAHGKPEDVIKLKAPAALPAPYVIVPPPGVIAPKPDGDGA